MSADHLAASDGEPVDFLYLGAGRRLHPPVAFPACVSTQLALETWLLLEDIWYANTNPNPMSVPHSVCLLQQIWYGYNYTVCLHYTKSFICKVRVKVNGV